MWIICVQTISFKIRILITLTYSIDMLYLRKQLLCVQKSQTNDGKKQSETFNKLWILYVSIENKYISVKTFKVDENSKYEMDARATKIVLCEMQGLANLHPKSLGIFMIIYVCNISEHIMVYNDRNEQNWILSLLCNTQHEWVTTLVCNKE